MYFDNDLSIVTCIGLGLKLILRGVSTFQFLGHVSTVETFLLAFIGNKLLPTGIFKGKICFPRSRV